MKATKVLIDFVLQLVQTFNAATLGGQKFSVRSLIGFAPALLSLPDAVNSFKAALAEIDGADDAGRAELNSYIKEKFSLADKGMEEKIEAVVSMLIKLSGVAPDVKVLFKKSAAPAAPQVAGVVNVQAEQVNVNPAAGV